MPEKEEMDRNLTLGERINKLLGINSTPESVAAIAEEAGEFFFRNNEEVWDKAFEILNIYIETEKKFASETGRKLEDEPSPGSFMFGFTLGILKERESRSNKIFTEWLNKAMGGEQNNDWRIEG